MANPEIDALQPAPEFVKLETGTFVTLESLRTRQFLKLLRIVTHGALPVLQDMSLLRLNPDDDPAEFTTRLLTLIVLSIPDAEDETIEFVRSMCKPYGLIEGRKLNKADAERNRALYDALDAELDNPDLGDLLTLCEAVVKREAADIQALGKRLAAMFKLANKMSQSHLPPQEPKSPDPDSTPATTNFSVGSPALSTYSSTSTGGAMTWSSTSPSVDFGSASPPSGNDATGEPGSDSNG